MLSIGNLIAIQLTTPLLLRKPCKLFASVARVCQRQLSFLVATLLADLQMLAGCRDLLDEAKDYHLMPDRRAKLHTFAIRPRCCSDVAGVIYAVGGLTSLGNIFVNRLQLQQRH